MNLTLQVGHSKSIIMKLEDWLILCSFPGGAGKKSLVKGRLRKRTNSSQGKQPKAKRGRPSRGMDGEELCNYPYMYIILLSLAARCFSDGGSFEQEKRSFFEQGRGRFPALSLEAECGEESAESHRTSQGGNDGR